MLALLALLAAGHIRRLSHYTITSFRNPPSLLSSLPARYSPPPAAVLSRLVLSLPRETFL
jgi:hypothetical protein